jgi:hypothetical protein
MEEIFLDKRILKNIDKRREELGLLYNRQQNWNPKQAIILKHLIAYSNLKMYINPKSMIDMFITSRHVWGHAYGHDTKYLTNITKINR